MSLEMVPLLVLLSSAVSGALGMGGGLLLMGALAFWLPPGPALALHGALQLAGNAQRAYLFRGYIAWRSLLPYLAGSLVALALLLQRRMLVDRQQMFLALGAVALVGGASECRRRPARVLRALAIDRSLGASLGGLLVTFAHFAAGAAGPLLHLFYLGTSLERRAVVASKAFTQALSHAVKISYVGILAPAALRSGALQPLLFALSLTATLVGTWLGGLLLERMREQTFRRATGVVFGAIGVSYLVRGLVWG